MLRYLTIENYRCFEDFYIDNLEQVNLFVGDNNSGKTSALEAIYLLNSSNRNKSLSEIIKNRIDYFQDKASGISYSIKELFNQYDYDKKIEIKSTKDKVLSISIDIQNNFSQGWLLQLKITKKPRFGMCLNLSLIICISIDFDVPKNLTIF